MPQSNTLQKIAHVLQLLGINGLAFALYMIGWLCLLAGLFGFTEATQEWARILGLAAIGLLLFALAAGLRSYQYRLRGRKGRRRPSWGAWLVLGLVTVLAVYLKLSLFPAELRALAKQRLALVNEQIIPAVAAYRQQHQLFPPRLELLVPTYLPALPAELDNNNYPQAAWQIRYRVDNRAVSASIDWRDCLGPDCGARIDLATGVYTHDL